MKLLPFALLVLAGAVAHFLLRGWPAWEAAAEARARMERRSSQLVALTRDADIVSYADVENLERDRNELARTNRERHANLLDASLAPNLPALDPLLRDTELAALDPVRSALAARKDTSVRAEEALARFITLVEGYGSVRVRSLETSPETDAAGLDGTELWALRADLVVTADLPDALDLLESFAPGQGEPVIWVRRATLQRIEPSGWKLSAPGASGAPVRLSVSASVLFGPPGRP